MSIRRFIAAGSGGRYTWPCFDLLARQGVYVVCAGVTLPNEASVGLHESLGFTAVGVFRDVSWKFGAWHDVGWWQMPLRDTRTGPRNSRRRRA